jgi:hypothetical protein
MRRLILIGFSLFSIAAVAQGNNEARLRFGFTTGVTSTWIDIKSHPNQISLQNNSDYGFRIGGVLSYSISRRFFASAQWIYSEMNVDATTEILLSNGSTAAGSVTHQNQWIELPIDFNFVFNPASEFKVFAGMGASLMLLSDVVKESSSVAPNRSMHTGVLAQVGVNVSLGQKLLRVSLVADKTLREEVKPIVYFPGYVMPTYDYAYTTLSLKATYFF